VWLKYLTLLWANGLRTIPDTIAELRLGNSLRIGLRRYCPASTTIDAPQREHSLREIFTGLRWIVRTGAVWRMMPHDLPLWHAVYQQSHRWLKAGVFDTIVQDLRAVLRLAQGRKAELSAAVFDSRTLQATPESGPRAGYDGAKRHRGSKVHMAVDSLGHLLALHVTATDEQDRS
jgi:transposase